MRNFSILIVCLLAFSGTGLPAQEAEPTETTPQTLEERLRTLQAEVQELRRALAVQAAQPVQPQAPAPAQDPQALPAPLPVYGGASATAKALNPDIGVIGNFIGAAGRNTISPLPSLSLRESEFSFQAIVDPYARADFFLSASEEGAGIEDGYVTFPALPAGFLVKVGRTRSNFGKMNPLHNHVLPWIDRPLITYNLMGGELGETDAGMKDEGLAVSRILPAPGGLFLEGSAELDRGDSGTLFQSHRRNDVSSIYHLRSYKDLSESTNLELGGSYARGHNDVGSDFLTQLAGLDAMLRWRPLRRAIYHSFIARSEMVWSRREEEAATQRAFGFFTSADYQLGRRWFAGTRYDWAERARDADQHDSAESLVLSYWPSEFSQIRGQLRRTYYAEGVTANEFLFQFQYTLGAHGAHPF